MTLDAIFKGIGRAKVAVVGDFCLDVYWLADMTRSELSRETPLFPLPIVEERMSCGAAGNVACNLAALRPAKVSVFGATGADWRGNALRRLLREAGVDADGLLEDPGRVTNAYCKPLQKGISDVVYEAPRLDFENDAPVPADAQRELLRLVTENDADVICVCDQMANGVVGDVLRQGLCELGRQGKTVIVDSRDRIGLYRHVIVKPNETEAAALGEKDPQKAVRALAARTGRPALVTLGEQGCAVCEGETVETVPAFPVPPPVDICGAGDAFLSGLACAVAAGCALTGAARFANACAAVTVKKLHTTGTATREEIAAITAAQPDC